MYPGWHRGTAAAGVAASCALALVATAYGADDARPGGTTTPPAAPAAKEAPSGLVRWLNPATAPFIPIPEIDTEPHSGLTLGLIPTWLSNGEHDEIVRIVAPDVIHSQYFGWGSRMRVFGFPNDDTQWYVVGGGKQRIEREFDGRYITGQTRHGAFSWSVEGIYDRSGTPRFFGLGNNSPVKAETSYIDNQALLTALAGHNFSQRLQLAYEQRVRYIEVLPGTLKGLPPIGDLYPTVEGLGSEHVLQQSVLLTYDTRDSPIIPRGGARYVVYDGFVSRAFGSSVSYTYFGVDARRYFPLRPDLLLAWHAGARYMPSAGGAPFWAMSSLGGDRSITNEREPLRGNGYDRYIDRNMFATGAELRWRVASLDAFGTRVSLEVTPFIDAGKVFPTMGESPITHLHSAKGLGVRALASPFVVGYVDIGFSHNKPAVFSGLNYPF
jgi:hypothetical protein